MFRRWSAPYTAYRYAFHGNGLFFSGVARVLPSWPFVDFGLKYRWLWCRFSVGPWDTVVHSGDECGVTSGINWALTIDQAMDMYNLVD